MTAPIRPKPPAVCNRNRDTAAPSRTFGLTSYDGGTTTIFDWLAGEQHLDLYGKPEAVPLYEVGRVKPEEFKRLTGLNKAAVEALSLLEAEVDKCRRVSR